MGHEFGVRLALIGFATALLQAALSHSELSAGIRDGLLALIVFYILGFIAGEVARRAVEEHVARLRAASAPAANTGTQTQPIQS